MASLRIGGKNEIKVTQRGCMLYVLQQNDVCHMNELDVMMRLNIFKGLESPNRRLLIVLVLVCDHFVSDAHVEVLGGDAILTHAPFSSSVQHYLLYATFFVQVLA
jgi:hypothetical protein